MTTPLNALCADLNCVSPEDSVDQECPILSKTRSVVISKGVANIVVWPLRRPDGSPVDLSSCFPAESSESSTSTTASFTVEARFTTCDAAGAWYTIPGAVKDAEAGTVQFAIPSEIYNQAGLYQMSIAVLDAEAGTPVFVDQGLLSVEFSLWGDITKRNGPPTLGQIRIHLRDTALENSGLLDEVEFDDAEILQAVCQPIHQWNETPPPVAPYTVATFPFHYHWMRAIVGELLLTAAHHYMRTNLKVNHGGISGNYKDKASEYLAVAQMYRQEWRDFIIEKKVSINAGQAYGQLGSPYASG